MLPDSEGTLRAFTGPAEYVDSHHPAVMESARGLAPAREDPRTVAVALFEFVRDLRYEAEDMQDVDTFRASHVLESGRAYCVPKAGLLAALARARGIPAAVAFADVRNHLASPRLRQDMGTDLFAWHGYTLLHLGGTWLSVSPTFDRRTCERAGVPPLVFDGVSDALLQAFDGGGHMRYEVVHGAFHDVPARFLATEMPRLYPFLANGDLERHIADR